MIAPLNVAVFAPAAPVNVPTVDPTVEQFADRFGSELTTILVGNTSLKPPADAGTKAKALLMVKVRVDVAPCSIAAVSNALPKVGIGAGVTVSVVVAVPELPRLLVRSPVVKTTLPSSTATTLNPMKQLAPAGKFGAVKLTPPATGVTTLPEHEPPKFGVGASDTPAGKINVLDRLFASTNAAALSIFNRTAVSRPCTIVVGLTNAVNTGNGAGVTTNAAVEVPELPRPLVRSPVRLLNVPSSSDVTFAVTTQVAPAAKVPPEYPKPPPGPVVALKKPPAQVFVMSGDEASSRSPGKTLVKSRFVASIRLPELSKV